MFQAMTHDDAGTRVQLVRFNVTYLPWSVGPLPKAVQREMLRVAMDGGIWNLRALFLGLIPSAVAFGWIAIPFSSGTLMAQSPYLLFMPFPIMFVVMLVMFRRLTPWALSDKTRQSCARVAARAGYCGSCGYPLPLEPNPVTRLCRCSECGAAWACEAW